MPMPMIFSSYSFVLGQFAQVLNSRSCRRMVEAPSTPSSSAIWTSSAGSFFAFEVFEYACEFFSESKGVRYVSTPLAKKRRPDGFPCLHLDAFTGRTGLGTWRKQTCRGEAREGTLPGLPDRYTREIEAQGEADLQNPRKYAQRLNRPQNGFQIRPAPRSGISRIPGHFPNQPQNGFGQGTLPPRHSSWVCATSQPF